MLKASAWREWWLRPGQRMSPAVPVQEIVDAAGAYNIVDPGGEESQLITDQQGWEGCGRK